MTRILKVATLAALLAGVLPASGPYMPPRPKPPRKDEIGKQESQKGGAKAAEKMAKEPKKS